MKNREIGDPKWKANLLPLFAFFLEHVTGLPLSQRRQPTERITRIERIMEKSIDRFEFDGENFHVVIEGGELTFTDKETGETIKRR